MSHVIVVGAGMAGLGCAHHLVREGHEVEVLDSEGTLGGQVRSQRREGLWLERGARWMQRTSEVDALLKEVGLEGAVGVLPERIEALTPDGLIPASPNVARPPGEPEALGDRLTLAKGLGSLARALAEPVTLRLGWEAEVVDEDPLGVTIHFVTPSGERSVRAEAAVLAVPRRVASGLSARVEASAVREESTMVVTLHLPGMDLAPREVRVDSSMGFDLASWEVIEGGGGCAVRGVLRSDAVSRWQGAARTAVVDHLLDELARTPLGRLTPTETTVDTYTIQHPEAAVEGSAGARVLYAGGAATVADALTRGRRAARAIATLG